ncbi:DNA-binding response regulator [Cohnella sp. CIP 111063]|uniref:response regulator transcription factor n=1 Tax=unclassified Cohnella TaxID=2636738 RepID=UPI000B8BF3F6|nr:MULTISPECIES: response regulator transcription factor [unclassified Cohnella]OXS54906.1 DNA-binding response regulator [Cohnella sp. CIP 111063]PRX65056.1 two-component system response regulator ResD [Cohnella sp. SGD-V74]
MNEQTKRILIVDDDEHIRRLLRLYLTNEGYTVDEAEDGETALRKTANYHFDLITLDLMLPGQGGIDVCSRLRRKKTTPIIIVTGNTDEMNRIHGFDVGADDYITKPFSPREVVFRIRAILRRTSGAILLSNNVNNKIILNDLVINHSNRTITVCGVGVSLTPKEYDLLHYLASSPDKAFSRETLLKDVWNFDYFGDWRTVDTHIKRLRKKIKSVNERSADIITTVRGIGYKLEVTGRIVINS